MITDKQAEEIKEVLKNAKVEVEALHLVSLVSASEVLALLLGKDEKLAALYSAIRVGNSILTELILRTRNQVSGNLQ